MGRFLGYYGFLVIPALAFTFAVSMRGRLLLDDRRAKRRHREQMERRRVELERACFMEPGRAGAALATYGLSVQDVRDWDKPFPAMPRR